MHIEYVSWDKKKHINSLNGKIVARFELGRIDKIVMYEHWYTHREFYNELIKETCLDISQLYAYCKGEPCYFWHIDDLEIFEKPKELSEFLGVSPKWNVPTIRIKKAPRLWRYAYDKDDNFCLLISIKPEHVCKILNGEKTIEVRKTIPNII